MKKIVTKLEKLGQKSAQFQQAMQSVPGKIAQIRETVAATTTQLQELRAEVKASVAGLCIEDEGPLLQAMLEIKGSSEALLHAGFDLASLEMELSPGHRLIVTLDQVAKVAPIEMGKILAANLNRPTTHALLLSLTRALEISDRVDLGDWPFRQVVVHIGPLPSLRLGWGPEQPEEEDALEQPIPSPAVTARPVPSAPAAVSAFTQSSYFEPRPSPVPSAVLAAPASPAPAASRPVPPPAPVIPPARPAPAPAPAAPRDWGRAALERFKKMPDVSKY